MTWRHFIYSDVPCKHKMAHNQFCHFLMVRWTRTSKSWSKSLIRKGVMGGLERMATTGERRYQCIREERKKKGFSFYIGNKLKLNPIQFKRFSLISQVNFQIFNNIDYCQKWYEWNLHLHLNQKISASGHLATSLLRTYLTLTRKHSFGNLVLNVWAQTEQSIWPVGKQSPFASPARPSCHQ